MSVKSNSESYPSLKVAVLDTFTCLKMALIGSLDC